MEVDKDFYKDSVVFITGATGFVGKVLLESLLWRFPQIRLVYILIREKRGASAEDRFQRIIDNRIFERLRKHHPERLKKLAYVAGNIAEFNLSLSDDAREKLCSEVNVVFHVAATVRFTETIQVAARMNVFGTYYMLELSKGMQHLKSFVYCSTAYCNMGRGIIEEKVYPVEPAVEWREFMSTSNNEYFDKLSKLLKKSPHPNTYTYTKSIAENIVSDYQSILPLVIVRPSIVTASHCEPYPGWVDNVQSLTGIMRELGKGSISSMVGNKDIICDIIPVDYVANSMIMMALRATQGSLYVCNCISGETNPITLGEILRLILKWGRLYPSKYMVQYPYANYYTSRIVHEAAVLLLHFVPAFFLDLKNTVLGKKTKTSLLRFARIYRQATLDNSEFLLNELHFTIPSRQYLKEIGASEPYSDMYWNLESLNYDDYFKKFTLGIQKYINREPHEPEANRPRLEKLYLLWVLSRVLLYLFISYVLYRIFA